MNFTVSPSHSLKRALSAVSGLNHSNWAWRSCRCRRAWALSMAMSRPPLRGETLEEGIGTTQPGADAPGAGMPSVMFSKEPRVSSVRPC